jgi:spermidine synthase
LQELFRETKNNQEILVYDTTELYGETGRFRVLEFANEAIQGAIDLDDPKRIIFEYPRAIIHLMEWNAPGFGHAFLIGHGIGTIAGHYRAGEKRFKTAEVDGTVVELSRRWFGYTGDNVAVGDGRGLLEQEPEAAYDYVILDAFTAAGTPRHLVSREFFRMVREKLHDRGAVIMNLIGKGGQDPLVNAVHTTLGEEYAHTKAFALPAAGNRDTRNFLIMAQNHRPVEFQGRKMAGFTEIVPGAGYVIRD